MANNYKLVVPYLIDAIREGDDTLEGNSLEKILEQAPKRLSYVKDYQLKGMPRWEINLRQLLATASKFVGEPEECDYFFGEHFSGVYQLDRQPVAYLSILARQLYLEGDFEVSFFQGDESRLLTYYSMDAETVMIVSCKQGCSVHYFLGRTPGELGVKGHELDTTLFESHDFRGCCDRTASAFGLCMTLGAVLDEPRGHVNCLCKTCVNKPNSFGLRLH